MPLFRKPLTEIVEADLQALITNQVPESRTLDYKRDAVGRSDGDKKEFLADVSSFANAAGGHLVFGMDEAGGVPSALPGLAVPDLDAEIRRLDELIRDGLDPTLLGVELRAVPLASGAAALVIRIPKSWNPPHQVTYQKTFRFYGRGAAGKHPLDVTAVRDLVLLSADVAERIRRLRLERIARILADETPVHLHPGARMILHAVPLAAFGSAQQVDFGPVRRNPGLLTITTGNGGSVRFNADGMLGAYVYDSKAEAYAQLYRTGVIEIVVVQKEWNTGRQLVLPSVSYSESVIAGISHTKTLLRAVGVAPPLTFMLTLIGVQGWEMGVNRRGTWFREATPFDRDPVFLPETLLTTYDQEPDVDARPLIDATWQAAGWPQSLDYNEEGRWSPHR